MARASLLGPLPCWRHPKPYSRRVRAIGWTCLRDESARSPPTPTLGPFSINPCQGHNLPSVRVPQVDSSPVVLVCLVRSRSTKERTWNRRPGYHVLFHRHGTEQRCATSYCISVYVFGISVLQLILHVSRLAYRHRPLHTPDYKFGERPGGVTSNPPPPPSRMGSAHFLGNFRSPAPLFVIGPPRQIAHYSCFPGAINEYKYQSCEALRLYQPPPVPFSFDKAPDKSTFRETCGYVDSLPQQGLEPVITSCQRAGCAGDLRRADVITRRGAVLK